MVLFCTYLSCVLLQKLLEYTSQFCDCCKEERWVTTTYATNERGEKFCQRCTRSMKALERPLYSRQNHMVGGLWRACICIFQSEFLCPFVSYMDSDSSVSDCPHEQIPGVLPPDLRNCTALEYRVTSPAAIVMQIYCVRGTG